MGSAEQHACYKERPTPMHAAIRIVRPANNVVRSAQPPGMPSSDSSSDEDAAKFAAVAVSADALHQQAERSKQASALAWLRAAVLCRRSAATVCVC